MRLSIQSSATPTQHRPIHFATYTEFTQSSLVGRLVMYVIYRVLPRPGNSGTTNQLDSG
uniref:Uncharacterized protein n=1 Tax=Arion vulgaris TaxID=1028688 RepID=A0A0B7B278_9EUPU